MKNQLDTICDTMLNIQKAICDMAERVDGAKVFQMDEWTRPAGGGGRTRVLADGDVFEQAGVNYSLVMGAQLPPSATAARPELAGRSWAATGVSVVMHPKNPNAPTSHFNVRFFVAEKEGEEPVWWFGGGFDLTPYYGFEEDCIHWHECARDAVGEYYPEFKKWCDDYFYLKHRAEPRGIGGIFFDDFNREDFDSCHQTIQKVADGYINGLEPILNRRKALPFTEKMREFQLYRRGRYVEFNLVYDRGTLFGLQSGGRTESILMSLPPNVKWGYAWQPEPNSDESQLLSTFLTPREWV